MMNKKILYLLLLCLSHSFARNYTPIHNKKYIKQINKSNSTDTIVTVQEQQQMEHYRTKMFKVDKKLQNSYADSLLIAALKSKNNSSIGKAYLSKGILYYKQKQLQKALDNYLLANEYTVLTKDQYTRHKIKYAIAQTKYYLELYHEAIALFKECATYFEEENDQAYLNSIHSLGLCFNKLGKTDSCSYYNNLGIKLSKELHYSKMIPYFNHSEGVNAYSKHQYKEAIQMLSKVVPSIARNNDFANESVSYFYIGKSYWLLGQKEKANSYFKKVDAIFEKAHYLRPDQRQGYELLIEYYKKLADKESELRYTNQLLKADRLLAQNDKYLYRKIVKEYDTKTLLRSKHDIENTLSFRTIFGGSLIAIMTIVITYLMYSHNRNKKRFNKIMQKDVSTDTSKKYESSLEKNQNKTSVIQDLNPDLEATILKKLEKFEQTKKYLEKDMTLSKMASLLNTNTKYVTKIIAKHRDKGTIDYITDLKIDYIVEILKTENKYRNYTNKALGEEAGFGSTQNFTKSFKSRNGISPTYFIYQLKKSINENQNG